MARVVVLAIVFGVLATGCDALRPGGGQPADAPPGAAAMLPIADTPSGGRRVEARYPAAWYGTTPLVRGLLITSFPIHSERDAFKRVPPDGAVVHVLRTVGASHARPRPRRLRLRPPATYGFYGHAHRVEFRERGATVIVLVVLGEDASRGTRRMAEAVLNSVHVRRGWAGG